jgi:hypothetical protein
MHLIKFKGELIMSKLLSTKTVFFFILFLLFGSNIVLSQCKIIFCSCCGEDSFYEIYEIKTDTLVGTFNTDDNGCSHTSPAGINLFPGAGYYVQESNPNCDQIRRTYFTACPCDEDLAYVMVPCCNPSENPNNKPNDKINNEPGSFKLNQNFPNPFNPSTKIDFELPEASYVKITVYDVSGKVVEELLNANIPAGYHNVVWNTSNKNISSGIYFYKLQAGNFTDEKKMVLIK